MSAEDQTEDLRVSLSTAKLEITLYVGNVPGLPPDRHKISRQDIARTMDRLVQLYDEIFPLLLQHDSQQAKSVIKSFYVLHDVLGRWKISLLPEAVKQENTTDLCLDD